VYVCVYVCVCVCECVRNGTLSKCAHVSSGSSLIMRSKGKIAKENRPKIRIWRTHRESVGVWELVKFAESHLGFIHLERVQGSGGP
jgi:hypothetical protein